MQTLNANLTTARVRVSDNERERERGGEREGELRFNAVLALALGIILKAGSETLC